MNLNKPDINKVWKALAKYGIKSEKELDEAIKNMNPINIGCMVSPVKKPAPEKVSEILSGSK
jgi:hypothetical protein